MRISLRATIAEAPLTAKRQWFGMALPGNLRFASYDLPKYNCSYCQPDSVPAHSLLLSLGAGGKFSAERFPCEKPTSALPVSFSVS